MDFIFERPTLCNPMPVMSCWSESERRSLRMILRVVLGELFEVGVSIIIEEKRRDIPAVIMNESNTCRWLILLAGICG